MASNVKPSTVTSTAQSTRVLNKKSWWKIQLSSRTPSGATPLFTRCIRECGWSQVYTTRVLKGYRQFLELKTSVEDWDAEILSPPLPIDQMWHQHILDVKNCVADCMLLCGNLVGHNPDGGFDGSDRVSRIRSTKVALKARFGKDFDNEICSFEEVAIPVHEEHYPEVAVIDQPFSPPILHEPPVRDESPRRRQRRRFADQIIIRRLTGELTIVTIDTQTARVQDLKEALRFPPDQQSLNFARGEMENARIVSDYGVTSGSTVELVLRLKGC
jgi:hypothetical protein